MFVPDKAVQTTMKPIRNNGTPRTARMAAMPRRRLTERSIPGDWMVAVTIDRERQHRDVDPEQGPRAELVEHDADDERRDDERQGAEGAHLPEPIAGGVAEGLQRPGIQQGSDPGDPVNRTIAPMKTARKPNDRYRMTAPAVATAEASGSARRDRGNRSDSPPQTGPKTSMSPAWIAIRTPISSSARPRSR